MTAEPQDPEPMTQMEEIAATPEMQAAGFQAQAQAAEVPVPGAPPITTSRPKSLIGNGLWSVAFTVWSTGVTFFLTPFLIGKIGTDHYGLFILLMSISGMMGIMNLGLGEATLRYVAYYYGRNDMAGINRVVGATFSVYVVMGLLGWAALFFGAGWITGLLALSPADQALGASLLRLTAFSFGLGFVSGSYASIPQALQRFDISTKVSIAQSIFQVAGTVTILFAGLGIYELVLWSVATAIFMQVVNTIVAKRLIPNLHLRPRPSKAGLKEVFGYGVFSLLGSILGMVWNQADRLLLGAFVNASAVAFLTVPYTVCFRGLDVLSSGSAALMPRYSMVANRKEQIPLFLLTTWGLLSCSVAFFVPVSVLLPDLLRLWISPAFARSSAQVGQIIAVSCLFRGAALAYQPFIRGIGKPHVLTVLMAISAVASLALNLVLIPRWGLVGAGYSYCLSVLWVSGMVFYAWRSLLRMSSLLPLLRAFVIPLLVGVCCLALTWYVRSLIVEVGWANLIAMGAGMFAVTATALLICDSAFGRTSDARILLRRVGTAINLSRGETR